MKKTKLYLNYAGHCFADENHTIKGGRKQKVTFNALWGLIQHPEKGWVLYDTGYTERFYKATKYFPNKIYALMTKVYIDPENEIKAQLERNNIKAEEIEHVLITHFHADHIAGLLDFPNAKIYTTRAALKQVMSIPRAIAFSKGILKSLLPSDLVERAVIIDEECVAIDDPILKVKYDLFNDGSIYAVPLPGHAAGQYGVLVETEKQPYFLIADACWLKKSYEEMVLPSQIVRLFFHSWKDFKESLKRVSNYHKAHPGTTIVPTHCAETTETLVSDNLNMNVL